MTIYSYVTIISLSLRCLEEHLKNPYHHIDILTTKFPYFYLQSNDKTTNVKKSCVVSADSILSIMNT